MSRMREAVQSALERYNQSPYGEIPGQNMFEVLLLNGTETMSAVPLL